MTRSGRSSRSASQSGSGGRAPQAASTASGNFAGMRGREHHHRHRRIARFLFRHGDADGGMRIDEMAGFAQHGADRRGGLLFVGAVGRENTARIADKRAAPSSVKRRDWASARHQRAHRFGVAAIGIEQHPLEIGGDLDIHRRRCGRRHLAQLVGAGRERARQDVVDVGRNHQPVDWQAHAHARHSRRRRRRNCRSAP